MKLNKAGSDLIKYYEKCSLNAYVCPAGINTIGWGNTFYEDGKNVKLGEKITQQRADSLFEAVADVFSKNVTRLLTKGLNDNQFSALVSFAYNTGIGNFQKSTLLKKVNINPEDISIRDEFVKWNKSNGKVLNGLTKRRKAEADLYFKNI